MVHGDLHPGNIIIQNITPPSEHKAAHDGNAPSVMMVDVGCDTFVMDIKPDPKPVRICLLDCGVATSLSPSNLASITAVFQQVVLGNVINQKKILFSKVYKKQFLPV